MDAILMVPDAWDVKGIKRKRIKRYHLPGGLGEEGWRVEQRIFMRATGSMSRIYSNRGYIQVFSSPLTTVRISA